MNEKKILKNDFKKISNLDDLVLVYGHFTTLHPGHIRYLENAKKKGKNLVIALRGDEKIDGRSKFIFSQEDRALSLKSISVVDYILYLGKDNLNKLIAIIKPSFFVLGKDFENTKDVQIKKAIQQVKRQKGKVVFDSGEANYASADLLSTNLISLSEQRKQEFLESCKKQKITSSKLLTSINNWNGTKIIVIGDSIIDQYAACEAIGMSAEAPVVVVKELKTKNFIGGAAIVASHISSLGAKCEFISVTGNDQERGFLSSELRKLGIGINLFVDQSRPTTFKKRYVVNNQKLFRVSKFEENYVSKKIENEILIKLDELAPKSNSIVISDFVYGVITPKIIKQIKKLSTKYNLQIFGDLQCSSQIGQITKFEDFSLLCPNEKEARIAINDKQSGLETISQLLIKKTRSNKLLMKLGEDGFILYEKDLDQNISSQYFPALSVNPLDVTGAGDSVLAVMAVGISSNQSSMISAAIASCVASIAVEQMGNIPINLNILRKKIGAIFDRVEIG